MPPVAVPSIDYTSRNKRRSTVSADCEQCGVAFFPLKNSSGRFCSKNCYHLRAASIEKPCLSCGLDFRSRVSENKKFCSRACYYQRLKGNDHAQKALGGRWSWKHSECIDCGKTDRKHAGKGLCTRCHKKRADREFKGTANAACWICSEKRGVQASHLIPRRVIGERWDPWLILPLCPTHHWCYDHDELTDEEWAKMEPRVLVAFAKAASLRLPTPSAVRIRA